MIDLKNKIGWRGQNRKMMNKAVGKEDNFMCKQASSFLVYITEMSFPCEFFVLSFPYYYYHHHHHHHHHCCCCCRRRRQ
jgi:ABC-type nickel/cobalt efflux system permease component RcnA